MRSFAGGTAWLAGSVAQSTSWFRERFGICSRLFASTSSVGEMSRGRALHLHGGGAPVFFAPGSYLLYWLGFLLSQSFVSSSLPPLAILSATGLCALFAATLVAIATRSMPASVEGSWPGGGALLNGVAWLGVAVFGPTFASQLLLAAAVEEFAFRIAPLALLLGVSRRLAVLAAGSLISALLFAMSHSPGDAWLFLDRLLVGVALALTVLVRAALLAVAAHAAMNIVAVAAPAFAVTTDVIVCAALLVALDVNGRRIDVAEGSPGPLVGRSRRSPS